MAKPGSNCAIYNCSKGKHWMAISPKSWNKTGCVIPCCLDWMHICPTESCRVVTFVMKSMYLAVQKFSHIWDSFGTLKVYDDDIILIFMSRIKILSFYFIIKYKLPRWRVVSVKTICRKMDFSRNCIAESTPCFLLSSNLYLNL